MNPVLRVQVKDQLSSWIKYYVQGKRTAITNSKNNDRKWKTVCTNRDKIYEDLVVSESQNIENRSYGVTILLIDEYAVFK